MKKKKDNEKVLYIAIIIIQFIIIIYNFVQINSMKKAISISVDRTKKIKIINSIASFSGINKSGKEEFIEFSDSSHKYYLFIMISSNCPYCSVFIEKFNKYLINNKIDNNIEIIYISHKDYAKKYLINNFKYIIIKDDQILQNFGNIVPVMFAVNGKGNVLFQSSKPDNDNFDKAFNTIIYKKLKTKN